MPRPVKLEILDITILFTDVYESQERRSQSWNILGNPEEMVLEEHAGERVGFNHRDTETPRGTQMSDSGRS
jgi:hypothetical protein